MAVALNDDVLDPLGINFTQYKDLPHPDLTCDSRVSHLPVTVPGQNNIPAFNKLFNCKLSSTHLGNKCGWCKGKHKGHDISSHSLFMVGDHLLPPVCGADGDCVPVSRVDAASFDHIQLLLEAQRNAGFDPAPGSILAVGLTHYLAAVGGDLFWSEFDKFVKYASREFKFQVMPFFMPFSKSLPETYRVRMHHGISALRARYLGNFRGAYDWRYALWTPLSEYFKSKDVDKVNYVMPPVILNNSNCNKIVVQCPNRAWVGIEESFAEQIPVTVENEFFPLLIKKVQEVCPLKTNFKAPSDEILSQGQEKTPPLEDNFDKDTPTVHLFGASIIGEVAELTCDIAKDLSVNIKNCCQGGKNNFADKDCIPVRNNDSDVLVIMDLGNDMMKKEAHRKYDSTFHYTRPKLLDDDGVNDLVAELQSRVKNIRKIYDGKIAIIGPLPRLLTQCCKNKAHHFPSTTLFSSNLQYAFLLNKFLAIHKGLELKNVFFVPYDHIFGNIFNEFDLRDGVHLVDENKSKLAEFLANITTFKVPTQKFTHSMKPSFSTWVDGIQIGAKKLFKSSTTKKSGAAERRPPACDTSQIPKTTDQPDPSNSMETEENAATNSPAKQPANPPNPTTSTPKKSSASARELLDRLKRLRQGHSNTLEDFDDAADAAQVLKESKQLELEKTADDTVDLGSDNDDGSVGDGMEEGELDGVASSDDGEKDGGDNNDQIIAGVIATQ